MHVPCPLQTHEPPEHPVFPLHEPSVAPFATLLKPHVPEPLHLGVLQIAVEQEFTELHSRQPSEFESEQS